MKNKAITLIELLTALAILFILVAFVLGLAGGGLSVSDGTRSGTLTKFSHKGLVNKSWEGELVMGGLRQSTTSAGQVGANVWSFSVMNNEVANKLEAYVGQEVKVKYHQTAFRNPLRRDTPYEVISIEAVHAEK